MGPGRDDGFAAPDPDPRDGVVTEILLVASGAIAGFVVGVAFGAIRAFRVAAARRAAAGAAAGLASLGLETLPTRTAADILRGRIRVVLGGSAYELRVLPRRASREWLGKLDADFAGLAGALDAAADDKPKILELLASRSDRLLAILREYDVDGVLPAPEFLDEFATDPEIVIAVVEVWRAANPLAAMLAEAASEETNGTSSEQPTPSLSPTDGGPITSTSESPTSNSSPISTLRPIV